MWILDMEIKSKMYFKVARVLKSQTIIANAKEELRNRAVETVTTAKAEENEERARGEETTTT